MLLVFGDVYRCLRGFWTESSRCFSSNHGCGELDDRASVSGKADPGSQSEQSRLTSVGPCPFLLAQAISAPKGLALFNPTLTAMQDRDRWPLDLLVTRIWQLWPDERCPCLPRCDLKEERIHQQCHVSDCSLGRLAPCLAALPPVFVGLASYGSRYTSTCTDTQAAL